MQEHQVLGELCLLMQLLFFGLMQGSDILFYTYSLQGSKVL